MRLSQGEDTFGFATSVSYDVSRQEPLYTAQFDVHFTPHASSLPTLFPALQ